MLAIFLVTLPVTVCCLWLQEICVRKRLFGATKWNMILCSAVIWLSASWILLPDWNSAGCPGQADLLSYVGEKMVHGHALCMAVGHWTYMIVILAGFLVGEIVYSSPRWAVVVFAKRTNKIHGDV